MRIVAIIQARMNSQRLPGKVLMDICGHPMLWHVINRLMSKSKLLSDLVVATTYHTSDTVITKVCHDWNIKCYRGSESNVMDRYYRAAKESKADIVVRITADCPCIDPTIVDRTIEYYLENKFEYATFGNIGVPLVPDYPDGFDCEVFSFKTLEKVNSKILSMQDREHVGRYMHNCLSYGFLQFYSKLPVKLSVDTKKDLQRVRLVFSELGSDFFIWDVIKYFEED